MREELTTLSKGQTRQQNGFDHQSRDHHFTVTISSGSIREWRRLAINSVQKKTRYRWHHWWSPKRSKAMIRNVVCSDIYRVKSKVDYIRVRDKTLYRTRCHHNSLCGTVFTPTRRNNGRKALNCWPTSLLGRAFTPPRCLCCCWLPAARGCSVWSAYQRLSAKQRAWSRTSADGRKLA